MMVSLSEALQDYQDAVNAFNWADAAHIDTAIARLTAAERFVGHQLRIVRTSAGYETSSPLASPRLGA